MLWKLKSGPATGRRLYAEQTQYAKNWFIKEAQNVFWRNGAVDELQFESWKTIMNQAFDDKEGIDVMPRRSFFPVQF